MRTAEGGRERSGSNTHKSHKLVHKTLGGSFNDVNMTIENSNSMVFNTSSMIRKSRVYEQQSKFSGGISTSKDFELQSEDGNEGQMIEMVRVRDKNNVIRSSSQRKDTD